MPGVYRLPDQPEDLLRVDDEMRAFFAARVERVASVERRLEQIAAAICAPDGLGFGYGADGIFDAREAFRRRGGNCLTFTILFIAVARDDGIPAVFNHVPSRPDWRRAGELVLEVQHVNARVDTHGGSFLVDIADAGDLRLRYDAARAMPDRCAFAFVYSDEGVRLLAAGDREAALAHLEKATRVDPESPVPWVNRGSAYVLLGRWGEAKACFDRALEIDAGNLAAISGLARVYRADGDVVHARRLEARAKRFRERNPYYLLHLADRALAAGDFDTASKWLSRAYRIKRDDAEIIAALVDLADRRGREREAARWRSRLAALDHGADVRASGLEQ